MAVNDLEGCLSEDLRESLRCAGAPLVMPASRKKKDKDKESEEKEAPMSRKRKLSRRERLREVTDIRAGRFLLDGLTLSKYSKKLWRRGGRSRSATASSKVFPRILSAKTRDFSFSPVAAADKRKQRNRNSRTLC